MERFTAGNFQTGGDFVANLSGFREATNTLARREKETKLQISAEQQAFNAAATAKAEGEYVSSSKNDILETIARIELNNPSDLKAFNESIAPARKATIAGAPEHLQGSIAQAYDAFETSARIRVMKSQTAEIKAGQFAVAQSSNDAFKTSIFNASRAGDDVSGLIEEAGIHLDEMVESGLIKETTANAEKKEILRESTEQAIRHNLASTADTDGISAALSDLDSIEFPAAWEPDQIDTFKRSARADLMRQQAQAKAQNSQAEQLAKVAVRDYAAGKGAGFKVSAEETARVKGMAAGFPELEKALALVEDIESFSLSDASDRAAMIEAGQTGNIEDSAEFAAMVTANSKINKMAQEDAYTLGVNQGVIDNVPFDPSDPNTLEQRVLQAEALSEHYGVEASPLTDPELTMLTGALPQMTPAEKVVLAETLAIAPELWGDIAKKGGGTFAMAGASGDRDVMNTVFTGQELINNKLVTPIKSSDYLGDFTDMVGGVYGAEDAMNVKNAALAYYATMGAEDYDTDLFKQAITAVTGGIGEINGFKIELPRGIEEDRFEDYIDQMQPETVASMGGVRGMTDEEAAELISRSALKNTKSGNYIVESNFGTLFKPDGTPFILEWKDDEEAINFERFKKKVGEKIIFDNTNKLDFRNI